MELEVYMKKVIALCQQNINDSYIELLWDKKNNDFISIKRSIEEIADIINNTEEEESTTTTTSKKSIKNKKKNKKKSSQS